MRIGIDGSRAFIKNRTGIEEYSYQVIKALRDYLPEEQVVLYVRKNQVVDFQLPKNWKVKIIRFPRYWTQLGLSLEMFLHPIGVLFIPAHTIPLIHPKKVIVVIHGLEYEFCPSSYSLWDRIYMRVSIKNSCRWASRIVSVSDNTKKDLKNLYGVSNEKMKVIYEGYDSVISNQKLVINNTVKEKVSYKLQVTGYLLFIGRIEERKNVSNIVKAFEILKEKYQIPHKLVLAGKPGFGYQAIRIQISNSEYQSEIIELGYVKEEEKWELLKSADVFVFPTLYEGFGIPILEAQSVGCSVVASNNSSIPEVVDGSALLVDCLNAEDIAENVYKILSNETLKSDIIAKGCENVKRFSWEKCAKEISSLLLK
ncbi:MAG: AprM [uncultured bacterium]|nr:MAG: AprM [uncultured bacterium]